MEHIAGHTSASVHEDQRFVAGDWLLLPGKHGPFGRAGDPQPPQLCGDPRHGRSNVKDLDTSLTILESILNQIHSTTVGRHADMCYRWHRRWHLVHRRMQTQGFESSSRFILIRCFQDFEMCSIFWSWTWSVHVTRSNDILALKILSLDDRLPVYHDAGSCSYGKGQSRRAPGEFVEIPQIPSGR